MISLRWSQVNAWRQSQHYLAQRLQPDGLIQAVRQTLGIHAQVMSAAEMAIAARVDGLASDDVQAALWQDRSLVKTWVMRQTLHLVPAADFSIYIAARRSTDIDWPELFRRNGIDRSTFEAYLEIASEILSGQPLTRQQFIQQVSEHLKSPELRSFLGSGSWGTAFKPLAWHGELCCGPNTGQNTTYLRPSAWIGTWREMDPEQAMQEIVRRYLRTYGPTTPRNFQVWWWMTLVEAKKAFNSLADELEEVDVEGWHAFALRSTIPSIQAMEPSGSVHMLPSFDAYTVGLPRDKKLQGVIALENRQKVYRLQGWVSAVILVDGIIRGTWEHKVLRSATMVTVNLFVSISEKTKEGLAVEAERLGNYLNTPVMLDFIQP